MKTLLCSLLLLLAGTQVIGQQATRLYYFSQPAGSFKVIGVKDSKGKIIIPAHYRDMGSFDTKRPITDSIIVLPEGKRSSPEIPAASYGDAFDRRGNLLYHPLVYDNGPDYFVEGLTRCVENDKIGFADRRGKVVITPQWDWVSPFQYGYAWACKDCYLDYSRDAEHPDILFRSGASRVVIDRQGRVATPAEAPASPKDQKIDDDYYPYPFQYTAEEQQLLDRFSNTKVLHQLAYMNYSPAVSGREAQLQFELVDKPPVSPYYVVQAYRYSNGAYSPDDELIFLVDQKGNWLHHGFLNEAPEPYASWLQKELKAAEDYFRTNPDAPNKFDTKPYRQGR